MCEFAHASCANAATADISQQLSGTDSVTENHSRIGIVRDGSSGESHRRRSWVCYAAFEPERALALTGCAEFRRTLAQGGWLNVAERHAISLQSRRSPARAV